MRPRNRLASTAAVLLAATLAIPSAALAQHGPGAGGPPVSTAPREARQFDFLLGRWELVAEPRVSSLAALVHGQPKLPGTWKAWRAVDGFGIEDEMRLTDDDGNPRALAHSIRVYDRGAGAWKSSTLDVYRTRFQEGTAKWSGGVMTSNSSGKDEDGRAFLARSRFYDIAPNSFRWQQARSYDGGRTWEKPTLEITAKRVGTPTAPR